MSEETPGDDRGLTQYGGVWFVTDGILAFPMRSHAQAQRTLMELRTGSLELAQLRPSSRYPDGLPTTEPRGRLESGASGQHHHTVTRHEEHDMTEKRTAKTAAQRAQESLEVAGRRHQKAEALVATLEDQLAKAKDLVADAKRRLEYAQANPDLPKEAVEEEPIDGDDTAGLDPEARHR